MKRLFAWIGFWFELGYLEILGPFDASEKIVLYEAIKRTSCKGMSLSLEFTFLQLKCAVEKGAVEFYMTPLGVIAWWVSEAPYSKDVSLVDILPAISPHLPEPIRDSFRRQHQILDAGLQEMVATNALL